MANKRSVYALYQGSDNKTKMLVDALNRNTDDLKHDLLTAEVLNPDGSGYLPAPSRSWGGDTVFQYKRPGNTLTPLKNNYKEISILNNTLHVKESVSEIVTDGVGDWNSLLSPDCIVQEGKKRKCITLGILGSYIDSDVECVIEFDAIVKNKFDLDPRYRLGVFIYRKNDMGFPAYYFKNEEDARLKYYTLDYYNDFTETIGQYYFNLHYTGWYSYTSGGSEEEKYDTYDEVCFYQSLHRDGQTHHYICPIKFPYPSVISIALVVDAFLYDSITGEYLYDESKKDLVSISNIYSSYFDLEGRTEAIWYFVEEDQDWKSALKDKPSLYTSNTEPIYSFGKNNDLFVVRSSMENITEEAFEHASVLLDVGDIGYTIYYTEEGIPQSKRIGTNSPTWVYNDDLAYSGTGMSFSVTGYNAFGEYVNAIRSGYGVKDITKDPPESLEGDFWIRYNQNLYNKINLYFNGLDPYEKYYIEYTIEFEDPLSVDDADIRYQRMGYKVDYTSRIPSYVQCHLSNSSIRLRDGTTTYTSQMIECFTDKYGVINLEIGISAIINDNYIIDYGPNFETNYDPFVEPTDFIGYSSLEHLIRTRGSGSNNTVYLIRDHDELKDTNCFYAYFKNGDDYVTTPPHTFTITVKNVRIQQYRTYNKIMFKYDGQWLSPLNNGGGGGGSEVSLIPLFDQGIKIADASVDGVDCPLWIPNGSYVLPKASENVLGGIKVGQNLQIDSDGRLSAIGGGSSVIANPEGEPIDRLNKIKIGSTIYDTSDARVEYQPSITTGELLGYINVGNTQYPIYAPISGGGGEGEGQMIVPFIEMNKVPTLREITYSNETLIYTPADIILTPIMTSNTVPSGTVTCSTYYSNNDSYNGWRAFKGQSCGSDCKDGWLANSGDNTPYLMYSWGSEKNLSKVIIETYNNATTATKTAFIEGLNSNNTWENCLATGENVSLDFVNSVYKTYEIQLNGNSYSAFRISGSETWFVSGTSGYACTISEVQIIHLTV